MVVVLIATFAAVASQRGCNRHSSGGLAWLSVVDAEGNIVPGDVPLFASPHFDRMEQLVSRVRRQDGPDPAAGADVTVAGGTRVEVFGGRQRRCIGDQGVEYYQGISRVRLVDGGDGRDFWVSDHWIVYSYPSR